MNHASQLQTFIGSKKLEEKIESEERYIQSLTEDGRLKQLSLKCAHNELIENLLKNISSFGLISMESSPQTIKIKLRKMKQAQIMSTSVVKESVDHVDDMNAAFSGKVDISTDNMSKYCITSLATFQLENMFMQTVIFTVMIFISKFTDCSYFQFFISSLGPKGYMSLHHHLTSVMFLVCLLHCCCCCCRKLFRKSSPLKLLCRIPLNFMNFV